MKPGPQPMNQLGLNPVFPPDIILDGRAAMNYDPIALSHLLSIVRNIDPDKRTATALILIKKMIESNG